MSTSRSFAGLVHDAAMQVTMEFHGSCARLERQDFIANDRADRAGADSQESHFTDNKFRMGFDVIVLRLAVILNL